MFVDNGKLVPIIVKVAFDPFAKLGMVHMPLLKLVPADANIEVFDNPLGIASLMLILVACQDPITSSNNKSHTITRITTNLTSQHLLH